MEIWLVHRHWRSQIRAQIQIGIINALTQGGPGSALGDILVYVFCADSGRDESRIAGLFSPVISVSGSMVVFFFSHGIIQGKRSGRISDLWLPVTVPALAREPFA